MFKELSEKERRVGAEQHKALLLELIKIQEERNRSLNFAIKNLKYILTSLHILTKIVNEFLPSFDNAGVGMQPSQF